MRLNYKSLHDEFTCIPVSTCKIFLHVKIACNCDFAFMPLEGSLGVIELHYIMNFTCIQKKKDKKQQQKNCMLEFA